MAEFKGGVKGAAEMLAKLDSKGRERILQDISQKDPEMAEELRKNMVTFEDLKYMTPQMLAKLLQDVDTADVALGLRTSGEELKSFFLNNVSKGKRKDIEDVLLGPPQAVSKVEESIEKVMKVVREKINKGELVIDMDGGEEYV